MFNGKKEKVLEERLFSMKERCEQQKNLFGEMAAKQNLLTEQFSKVEESRTQMERDMQQVEEHVGHITEMTEETKTVTGELQSEMIAINNAIGTFDANHSIFLKQRKAQDEKIVEIVEKNKHFTTPMKYISETPSVIRGESQKILEQTGKLKEFSKSMGVLSLNAAIEAGRMGEVGSKFIAAAEEIRTFSENHEKEILKLEEDLKRATHKVEDLEEQVHHLNELLKENNISMGKLMKDGLMSMSSYETGQINLRSIISDHAISRAAAIVEAEKETAKIEERMRLQLGDIHDEMEAQKNCTGEMESIVRELQQAAENGQAG